MVLTKESSNKIFGGYQKIFSHDSEEVCCKMRFGVYLPPQVDENKKLPVIYWLSGLTCSKANFIEKSGAQRYAAEYGIIIVNSDTSPRGLNIPGGSENWDIGVGTGFYVNSTKEPWKKITECLVILSQNYQNLSIIISLQQRDCPDICIKKSRNVQICICFRSHLQSFSLPLGNKNFYRVLGI
ncbi:unnamed protein product [Psylliodes chrysocephalus]|uniref:S-formylglutathione hydrolase n=1 Tax=Psylliodes chrysocephalus TaxID=3402493 RepID=A0A9P0DC66_9CUCU|nr:unnamed protein product [Psylliodes chrysocephala]